MKCGSCGLENSEGIRYCGSCGTPLETGADRRCPRCGATMPESFRACQVCGFSTDWKISKRSPGAPPPSLRKPDDFSEPAKWLGMGLMVWGAFEIYWGLRMVTTYWDHQFLSDAWYLVDTSADFVVGTILLFLGLKVWGWSRGRQFLGP